METNLSADYSGDRLEVISLRLSSIYFGEVLLGHIAKVCGKYSFVCGAAGDNGLPDFDRPFWFFPQKTIEQVQANLFKVFPQLYPSLFEAEN